MEAGFDASDYEVLVCEDPWYTKVWRWIAAD